ncbi:MAG: long-chain fatty acid--CoA ligase [Deltaproteobacteria bacterium]|nr:long-chain fatty acid--CoA ligase [Deltaproteobacteria bacterium]
MSANWLNLGQIYPVNARKYPDHIAFMDETRSYTFPESNRRVNQISHALLSLGLTKGDKISCYLENCIEICELYVACAKTGIIINPVNFRLVGPEVRFIVDNADSKAMFVHKEFTSTIDKIKGDLQKVKSYFVVGGEEEGYEEYESWIAGQSDEEPGIEVLPEDIWILLYTSGTTGRPKGVLRSHESYTAFYLINGCDFHFHSRDVVLTCMPLCHVNTTFFSFTVTYLGGSNYIHPAMGFRPPAILDIIQKHKITFISLIPTHYNLILNEPMETLKGYELSSIDKLLCSSAPARIEHKKMITELIPGVRLFEGYGSTEAGIVTTLMPHEQLTKPGSIGKESCGTDFVKVLGEDGNEVPVGEVGELYSRGPMMFSGYYKLPEQTAASFNGEHFTAGDMARRDEDDYFYLVDRKKNMIITGGENVYPSEVENVLVNHNAVFDVAVIGLPHEKWGEQVSAVIILKEGKTATAEEIMSYCKDKMAGYKRPRDVRFIKPDEMPRTGTGKILHRILREKFSG